MADFEYPAERLASLLAARIVQRRDLIRQMVAPKGQRVPFTKLLSEPDALAFWQKNRNSAAGRDLLGRMAPADIFELDLALAQFNEGGEGEEDDG